MSLGLDSAAWNGLDQDKKDALVSSIIGEAKSDPVKPESTINVESVKPGKPDDNDKPKADHYNKPAGSRTKKVEPARRTVGTDGSSQKEYDQKNYSYKSFLKSKKPRKKLSIKPGAVLIAVLAICIMFALNEQRKSGSIITTPATQPSENTVGIPDILQKDPKDEKKYEFTNCLYYDSISDRDKEVYQVAYDLVMHKDERGYDRTLTMDNFEYGQRENELFNGIHAMLSDHPEFFYLQSNGRKFGIRTVSMGSICNVTFSLGEGEPDENEKIAKFEAATKNFMNGIDLSVSDPEIELQIHDKLIDLVSYDYDLIARNTYGDLGYTAYGALVEDSYGSKNKAVCGGYAQAFQYLLGQAGIEAAYVSGYADSESGTLSEQGSHAWNIVRLDDEWYEVDSCWDDIDPPPNEPDKEFYKLIKAEQPQYFNATHHWYNRTTDEMAYLPEGAQTTIRVQQGDMIRELSPCARSTHLRKKEKTDEAYEVFEYLNRYLPKATGIKHAL